MLHLALAATAAAVCTEVRDKLKAAHIDVRALIKSTLPSPPTNSTPEQLALSLTGQPNEMFITWVLPSAGDVCADSHASIGSTTFPASWATYEAGVAGWEGHVYTAKMTGLTPGVQALYSVTSCGKTTGPVPFTGPMAVGPQAETLIAVMADMGTVIPLGYVVWLESNVTLLSLASYMLTLSHPLLSTLLNRYATAAQIAKDHAKEPFDLFVLAVSGALLLFARGGQCAQLTSLLTHTTHNARVTLPTQQSTPPRMSSRRCGMPTGASLSPSPSWHHACLESGTMNPHLGR
jgi:hypothetical protein